MDNLTTKNNISKNSIRHMVVEVLQEVLADPDFGLELNSKAIKDIKESVEQKKRGKVISLEEILKKRK